ncbi:MAG: hypothetical protein IKV59_07725 [Lachnospiraceae bacterium]|nr:hypothetical protein [Lachnospiraceae bacterium]
MKNKSKLQKIQKKKISIPSVPAEWLYFMEEEMLLREIYEIFMDDAGCSAEFWQEAGVLEIAVPEYGSVDVEEFEEIDEDLQLYMEEHHLKSVFAVTIVPEHYEKARQMMEKILSQKGGYFCGDTDDFLPEIRLG